LCWFGKSIFIQQVLDRIRVLLFRHGDVCEDVQPPLLLEGNVDISSKLLLSKISQVLRFGIGELVD
jgi:hypothetical protein